MEERGRGRGGNVSMDDEEASESSVVCEDVCVLASIPKGHLGISHQCQNSINMRVMGTKGRVWAALLLLVLLFYYTSLPPVSLCYAFALLHAVVGIMPGMRQLCGEKSFF